MDSFFGIGAPELLLILILAGIVMGPQRIRQTALWLGKTTAQLQSISRGFVRQLNAELDSVDRDGDLKSALAEVQELRKQVTSMRADLASVATAPLRESQKAVEEGQEALRQTIMPPRLASVHSADPMPPADEQPAELPSLLPVDDDPDS